MVAVLIGGTDRTANTTGVQYSLRLGGRGVARLNAISTDGSWRPVVGQVVEVYDNDGQKRWQGTIDEVRETNQVATNVLTFELSCTSMEHRFEKRLIVPPVTTSQPRTDFCRLEFTAEASEGKITAPGHHFAAGDRVRVSNSGGALPGGLSDSTTYWVISVLDDDVWISTTQGGSGVTITSAGTGTHSVSWMAGSIVARLLSAAGESISAGTINEGATVDKVVYDNRSYSEAFDELATWSNCWWFVDTDSALQFVPRSTFTAPANLTTDNVLAASVRNTREDYRNAQSIRGEITAISPIEETITGDASRTVFALDFAAARVESISVGGRLKSLAVWGTGETAEWYWAYGDNRVIQDVSRYTFTADVSTDKLTCSTQRFDVGQIVRVENSGGALPGGLLADTDYYVVDVSGNDIKVSITPAGEAVNITSAGTGTHSLYTGVILGVGDTAIVTYRRLGADVIDAIDTAQVSARAAVEGGSGRYDYIFDDGNNTDAVSALGKAQATLEAYNGIASELELTTDATGYQPGQLATVVLAKYGLNGTYLITAQDVEVIPTGDDDTTILRSRVTLVGENRVRSWIEYFQGLSGGSSGGGPLITGGTASSGGVTVVEGGTEPVAPDEVKKTGDTFNGSVTVTHTAVDGNGLQRLSIAVVCQAPDPIGTFIGVAGYLRRPGPIIEPVGNFDATTFTFEWDPPSSSEFWDLFLCSRSTVITNALNTATGGTPRRSLSATPIPPTFVGAEYSGVCSSFVPAVQYRLSRTVGHYEWRVSSTWALPLSDYRYAGSRVLLRPSSGPDVEIADAAAPKTAATSDWYDVAETATFTAFLLSRGWRGENTINTDSTPPKQVTPSASITISEANARTYLDLTRGVGQEYAGQVTGYSGEAHYVWDINRWTYNLAVRWTNPQTAGVIDIDFCGVEFWWRPDPAPSSPYPTDYEDRLLGARYWERGDTIPLGQQSMVFGAEDGWARPESTQGYKIFARSVNWDMDVNTLQLAGAAFPTPVVSGNITAIPTVGLIGTDFDVTDTYSGTTLVLTFAGTFPTDDDFWYARVFAGPAGSLVEIGEITDESRVIEIADSPLTQETWNFWAVSVTRDLREHPPNFNPASPADARSKLGVVIEARPEFGNPAPPPDLPTTVGDTFDSTTGITVSTTNPDSNGVRRLKIKADYNLPSPIGTFVGVAAYLQRPANDVPEFIGNFDGSVWLEFTYEAPADVESWTLYLCSRSTAITNALNTGTGGTPRRSFTASPIAAGSSGQEWASLVTSFTGAARYRATEGGQVECRVEGSFAIPDDDRYRGVRIVKRQGMLSGYWRCVQYSTSVEYVSGNPFDEAYVGKQINSNGVNHTIASVADPQHLTLQSYWPYASGDYGWAMVWNTDAIDVCDCPYPRTTWYEDWASVPAVTGNHEYFALSYDALNRENTLVDGTTPKATVSINSPSNPSGIDYAGVVTGLTVTTVQTAENQAGVRQYRVIGSYYEPWDSRFGGVSFQLDFSGSIPPSGTTTEIHWEAKRGAGTLRGFTTDWLEAVSTSAANLYAVSVDSNGRRNAITSSTPRISIGAIIQGGTLNLAYASPQSLTAASFASTIAPVALSSGTPTGYIGGMVYDTVGRILYRWNGSSYGRAMSGSDIKAELTIDQLTAGQIAAGAIGTTQLSATEILVGSGGGKPPRISVMSGATQVGFIGDNGAGFVGGYLYSLRVGADVNNPIINANGSSVAISGATFTYSGNGARVILSSYYAQGGYCGLYVDNGSGNYQSIIQPGLVRICNASNVVAIAADYSGNILCQNGTSYANYGYTGVTIQGLAVVGSRKPAVSQPTGGTYSASANVDTAARQSIMDIINRLQWHGLIS